ncbi:hypothetical protein MKL09_15505 [Methylobacterium sp. J-048]|uniref:hypothetical protein n=1 Tax=Methylobacterium sp. J-048 TaxID=2836635 RepID=UPI001FBBE7FB|nr:hypothetical protein [Methylobacterium sp. J-048]MCJ2057960.1 hypothetical protein [Methylobacterium sp. J-048]
MFNLRLRRFLRLQRVGKLLAQRRLDHRFKFGEPAVLCLDDPVFLKHNIGCREVSLRSALANAFRIRRTAQLKHEPWLARQRHCFVVPVVDLVNLELLTG